MVMGVPAGCVGVIAPVNVTVDPTRIVADEAPFTSSDMVEGDAKFAVSVTALVMVIDWKAPAPEYDALPVPVQETNA